MKKIICFVSAFFVVTACTLDKTDYESETNTSVPDQQEFKEVLSFEQGSYSIQMEALDGKLYTGYNEVRLHLVQTSTQQVVEDAVITFLPVQRTTGGKESCPHSDQLQYHSQDDFYKGYSVFTKESTAGGAWEVILRIAINGHEFEEVRTVTVLPQHNSNLSMTSFIGNDEEHYIIALVAPSKPKVAENQLVAGIFKYSNAKNTNTEDEAQLRFAYSSVTAYKLFLDPRMPEPSMGNHSSPNNKDLLQGEDELYYGVVNYTMTGNWTLNFILQNDKGRLVKGTKVSTDFTPGVAGVKSELFIDILF